jgi:mTERF domain-containing protein, mitochondrial
MSPARPETVVKFLTDTGLSDIQIRYAISLYPIILSFNVDKILKPRFRELIDAGCTEELLVQLIRYNPASLSFKDACSRLLFWRDFFGKDDKALLKLIKGNSLLVTKNVDQYVLPRINLLKEFGLSNPDIVSLLQCVNRFMTQNLDSLRQTIDLIEELGIQRGSRKFLPALKAVGRLSKDIIKRKLEFFKKTYGWSQKGICSAFKKFPSIITYSEDKVKSNMDFLTGKAGFDPRSVATYPDLIGGSLERVLIQLAPNRLKLFIIHNLIIMHGCAQFHFLL